jgi:hypothetical protein
VRRDVESIAGVKEQPQPVTDWRSYQCYRASRDHRDRSSRNGAIAAAPDRGAEAGHNALCTESAAEGAKQITGSAQQRRDFTYQSVRSDCHRSKAAATRFHTALTDLAD